jgi:hypothetical protein
MYGDEGRDGGIGFSDACCRGKPRISKHAMKRKRFAICTLVIMPEKFLFSSTNRWPVLS